MGRERRNDCPGLAAILAGWDGQMTALRRKRVNRHLGSCAVCAERRRRVASAPALFGGLPLLLPPSDLRARVLSDAFDPKLVDHRDALGRRVGRLKRDGFPARPRLPLPPAALAAAAMIALALGAGALVLARAPPTWAGGRAAGPVPGPSVLLPFVLAPSAPSALAPSGGPQQGAGTSASAQPVTGAGQAPPAVRPQLVAPAEIDLHTASKGQLHVSVVGATFPARRRSTTRR